MTPSSPPFFTPYGSSLTTTAVRPPRSSSMCARARMTMRPRPDRYASRIPSRPTMIPAVGKSGPLTCCISRSTSIDGSSIIATSASTVSPRWCGGMFVAMPTAMPDEPLTSRFGKRAGSDRRLAARLVVVRLEVDRVRVDVAEQLGRQAREPALRVPHRRGGVAVDVPEVPLAVDERVPHRKRLSESDERVVDRGVAVRVVLPHHGADDVRALLVRPARLHPGLVHPVEDAPVHRLETVAHVGQRPRDDDAHRVVEEARAHLLLELARLDSSGAQAACIELDTRSACRFLRGKCEAFSAV